MWGADELRRQRMDIKVFGERNTGTRAITRIIRHNSKSFVYQKKEADILGALGHLACIEKLIPIKGRYNQYIKDYAYLKKDLTWQWKHCATNFESLDKMENVHIVFMVRDPLSWLLSLYKNPYERFIEIPEEFGEFIHCEWKTSGRERLKRKTISPVKLYEKKLLYYRKFMKLLDENNITYSIIRLEDLIRDQKAEFQKIEKFLDSPQKKFEELKESTKSRNTSIDYYRNYYNNGLWRNEISIEVRRNFHFNAELMRWLNYDPHYYVDVE